MAVSNLEPVTVAVVIPIWNEKPRFFRSCLESVARQTIQSDSLIVSVFDDGSPEARSETYQQILTDVLDVEYQYERSATNMGVSYARNRAINNISADIVVPLDADDILHPSALEQIRYHLMASESTDVVYTDNVKFEWPSLELYQYREKALYHKCLCRYNDTVFNPLYQASFVVGAQGYTRESFEAAGGYDEAKRVAEDVDLLLNIHSTTDKVNFSHIPEVLYYRRHESDSLSRSRQEEMHHSTEQMLLEAVRDVTDNVVDVKYFDRVKPYQVSHYLLQDRSGKVIDPPYLDLTNTKLNCGRTAAELENMWNQSHKSWLVNWLK